MTKYNSFKLLVNNVTKKTYSKYVYCLKVLIYQEIVKQKNYKTN